MSSGHRDGWIRSFSNKCKFVAPSAEEAYAQHPECGATQLEERRWVDQTPPHAGGMAIFQEVSGARDAVKSQFPRQGLELPCIKSHHVVASCFVWFHYTRANQKLRQVG